MIVTVIDLSTLFKDRWGKAIEMIDKLSKVNHPNLVTIYNYWFIPDEALFIEIEPPSNLLHEIANNQQLFDNKSWKTFCKKKFKPEELLEAIK